MHIAISGVSQNRGALKLRKLSGCPYQGFYFGNLHKTLDQLDEVLHFDALASSGGGRSSSSDTAISATLDVFLNVLKEDAVKG